VVFVGNHYLEVCVLIHTALVFLYPEKLQESNLEFCGDFKKLTITYILPFKGMEKVVSSQI
jgi:hypothetical protein